MSNPHDLLHLDTGDQARAACGLKWSDWQDTGGSPEFSFRAFMADENFKQEICEACVLHLYEKDVAK